MTLREYLSRGGLQDRYWLVLPITLVCNLGLIHLLPRTYFGIAVMISVPGTPLVYIYAPQLFRLVRCPRCHARLEELAYVAVMGHGSQMRWAPRVQKAARRAERLGKCPNCGLRLDEEIGPAKGT